MDNIVFYIVLSSTCKIIFRRRSQARKFQPQLSYKVYSYPKKRESVIEFENRTLFSTVYIQCMKDTL